MSDDVRARPTVLVVVACLLAGCSNRLRHDVELFCDASSSTPEATIEQIAARFESPRFVRYYEQSRTGEVGLDELAILIDEAMVETGIDRCATRDVFEKSLGRQLPRARRSPGS